MNNPGPQNTFDYAQQMLRQLVLEYRSIPRDLVDRIEPESCLIIVSQFAVWLLDTSMDTLRLDWQRELHSKVRELHRQRSHGELVDMESWNSVNADSLAGSKLWPPEWLCASCFPSAPPIARTAAAIAIAQYRLHREKGDNVSRIDYRKVQADMLQTLIASHIEIVSSALALMDDDELQQDAALQSLVVAEIGPQSISAVPALIEALGSDREIVRRVAAGALAKIGGPAKFAIEALADALQRERRHGNLDCLEAIWGALHAIASADSTAAVEAVGCLVCSEYDADPFLEILYDLGRTALIQAFRNLNKSAFIEVVCWCRDKEDNLLVEIFRDDEVQKEGVIDHNIFAALEDMVWRKQMSWKNQAAFKVLVAALERSDGNYREDAISILNQLSWSIRNSVPNHLREFLQWEDEVNE